MKKENELPAGVRKTLLMNKLHGQDSESKKVYLETYLASIKEAHKLLEEAELLFKNNHHERAYFLAFSGLEEISKSQMAADVFTGYMKEEDFEKVYMFHRKKISRVEWIRLDGNSLYGSFFGEVSIKDFDFNKKLKSMYVDVDFSLKKVMTPNEAISREDAESAIRAVKVGLLRIYQVTEEEGEQIGTKGFMK